MPWNKTAPDGNKSVKANEAILQANTTYIETTMGDSPEETNLTITRDHYWNVDPNLDGRHRFIQSRGFQVGGTATDPVVGDGMDAVFYAKEASTSVGRIEWFTRNDQGVYQVSPSFLSGTVSITSKSTYVDVVAVPANVYGEIFMYFSDQTKIQHGTFITDGSICNAFSTLIKIKSNTEARPRLLEFGNGTDALGLNIRAVRTDGPSGNWTYKVIYRAL